MSSKQTCDSCEKRVSPLKQEMIKTIKQTQSGRDKQTVKKAWLCSACRTSLRSKGMIS